MLDSLTQQTKTLLKVARQHIRTAERRRCIGEEGRNRPPPAEAYSAFEHRNGPRQVAFEQIDRAETLTSEHEAERLIHPVGEFNGLFTVDDAVRKVPQLRQAPGKAGTAEDCGQGALSEALEEGLAVNAT